MLGHASAAMTLDVYADLFDDDLDTVAIALNHAASSAIVGKLWANGPSAAVSETASCNKTAPDLRLSSPIRGCSLAVAMGFEPMERSHAHTLSRRAP
jgi:hypothetical protein